MSQTPNPWVHCKYGWWDYGAKQGFPMLGYSLFYAWKITILPTAIPRSMVINTRKLWGVTKKVQLITMGTLITMSFQMVLISWVYIWPQNCPKRSLSNLSWNFWVFLVTSSGRNGKLKGGECFCFGNFLALFVLPSLLCAHSHQERENWEKPSLVLITH